MFARSPHRRPIDAYQPVDGSVDAREHRRICGVLHELHGACQREPGGHVRGRRAGRDVQLFDQPGRRAVRHRTELLRDRLRGHEHQLHEVRVLQLDVHCRFGHLQRRAVPLRDGLVLFVHDDVPRKRLRLIVRPAAFRASRVRSSVPDDP